MATKVQGNEQGNRTMADEQEEGPIEHSAEFGLLQNRPDASLLPRARWIASAPLREC